MNVLIVDDEPFQRRSFCSLEVWQDEECEIIGAAANGEEALRILSGQSADLVVTDLRMPSMDGIELAREIRLRFPATRVVILSAFDDFHLVKDSFQTGVYDYLLKAEVDEGQIREIVHKIRSEFLTTMGIELQERGFLTYETFLKELRRDPAEVLQSMGAEPNHNRFVCFGYKLTTSSDAVLASIGKRLRNYHQCLPIRPEPFKILAAMAVPPVLDYAGIETYVERLFVGDNLPWFSSTPFDWSAGINSFFSDVTLIPRQLSAVDTKLEKTFFNGWNRLYRHQDDETDSQQVLDEIKGKRDFFLSLLYHKTFSDRDIKRLEVIVEPRFASVATADQIRNYFRWFSSQIQDFALENNLTFDEDLPRLLREFNLAVGRGDTLTKLNDQQTRMMRHLGNLGLNQHSLVSRAKEFIRSELPKECLVSEIAASLAISPAHLSRTFKAQENMSIKSYIIGERIRFARKLMVDGDLKIYQIAEASGFASVEHFSRTFKKVMGMGPKQYMTR
jgi:two-component system, response regulator YesN